MVDENILHEGDTRDVVDDQVEKTTGLDHEDIEDVDAVGTTYSQAEVNAIVDTLNAVLQVLRDNDILVPAEV